MKFFGRFFNKKYMTVTDENGKLNIFGLAIPLFSAILNALLVFLYFKHRKIKTNMRFSWRWCKNIYKIGFPSMMSSIFYTLGQTITASLTLSLAPSAFLAKNYVGQLVYFVYIFGYSLGQANAIITGRVCGKGDFLLWIFVHRAWLWLGRNLGVFCARRDGARNSIFHSSEKRRMEKTLCKLA